jgi:hypothetical protein
MTLIFGLKVKTKKEGEASSLDDKLVMVADSMALFDGSLRKADDKQKLFVIGEHKDFIMMCSGAGVAAEYVASEAFNAPMGSLEDAAKKILDVTNDRDAVDANVALNFIVGGRYGAEDGKEPRLGFACINATGNNPELKKSRWSDRGFRIDPLFAINGYASSIVMDYRQQLFETGKGHCNDVADALALAFEFGKNGAKAAFVNEKIQIGIVTKDRVSAIYPPDVRLQGEIFTHYLNHMSGLNLPTLPDNGTGSEIEKIIQARTDVNKMLDHFYTDLITDLRDYSGFRMAYTAWSEAYANDDSAKPTFEAMRARRSEAKKNVMRGANALIARGLPALIEYVDDFAERKKQLEERLRKLPEEYRK